MPELAVKKRQGNFNEVELGYDESEGQAEAARCLNCGYCCECYQCVDACLANAIDHSQQDEILELDVGSVILCPGSEPYDPTHLENVYHYKTSPNVVTSLEFERLLSASGPTMGHLERPSDDQQPKKIAWLQCVGSRDNNQCGNGYCSSVCCMYACKDSMIAKEHAFATWMHPVNCRSKSLTWWCFRSDSRYRNRQWSWPTESVLNWMPPILR
jgi:heterodisulfide reductase subunit A-like polyferredoxin